MKVEITKDEIAALAVTIGALKSLLGRNPDPDEYMRMAEAFVDRARRKLSSPAPKRAKKAKR